MSVSTESNAGIAVLVVDDEPDVEELFKRKFRRELKRGEYILHFAQSGESALAMIKDGFAPELVLILSDINMPGMSGIELLAKVKKLWPQLPIAMITAYGDEAREQEARSAGASEFLSKPLDFAQLKDRMATIVSNQQS